MNLSLIVAFKRFKFDIHEWYLSFRQFVKSKASDMDLCHVNSGVSCEIYLLFVGFAAFVALERPLPRVRPYVALQTTRLSECGVALAALEWFFSSVVFHHVNF